MNLVQINFLYIGRFPSKRCVTTFQNNLFLTCQRLNIWLFSYHFALLSVLQKWLLCQPTLFTKNPPNIGNIFDLVGKKIPRPSEFVYLSVYFQKNSLVLPDKPTTAWRLPDDCLTLSWQPPTIWLRSDIPKIIAWHLYVYDDFYSNFTRNWRSLKSMIFLHCAWFNIQIWQTVVPPLDKTLDS